MQWKTLIAVLISGASMLSVAPAAHADSAADYIAVINMYERQLRSGNLDEERMAQIRRRLEVARRQQQDAARNVGNKTKPGSYENYGGYDELQYSTDRPNPYLQPQTDLNAGTSLGGGTGYGAGSGMGN